MKKYNNILPIYTDEARIEQRETNKHRSIRYLIIGMIIFSSIVGLNSLFKQADHSSAQRELQAQQEHWKGENVQRFWSCIYSIVMAEWMALPKGHHQDVLTWNKTRDEYITNITTQILDETLSLLSLNDTDNQGNYSIAPAMSEAYEGNYTMPTTGLFEPQNPNLKIYAVAAVAAGLAVGECVHRGINYAAKYDWIGKATRKVAEVAECLRCKCCGGGEKGTADRPADEESPLVEKL